MITKSICFVSQKGEMAVKKHKKAVTIRMVFVLCIAVPVMASAMGRGFFGRTGETHCRYVTNTCPNENCPNGADCAAGICTNENCPYGENCPNGTDCAAGTCPNENCPYGENCPNGVNCLAGNCVSMGGHHGRQNGCHNMR